MAMVIPSEDDGYFSSTLRRSHSQPKFNTQRSDFHTSASTSRLSDLYCQSPSSFPLSTTSSTASSPRTAHVESSDLSSCLSTPATNFSLGSDCDEGDHQGPAASENGTLTSHEDMGYFGRLGNLVPLPSPQAGESDISPSNEQDDSADTTRPGSPELNDRAEDDIAIRARPSRHVDYLSHNWREEDIWSSWKLIVARRGDYSNAARLENASWRTWMKSKNKLSTVSPETLNWLKDYDVTWLYGPLQTGMSSVYQTSTNSNSGRLSKSNSFIKKPILKKRSVSEIMLQRSLSTSSLVKQAAAAVQAQQKEGMKRIGRRPGLERATTDYVTFPFSSRGVSQDGTSLFPSTRSSGIVSPSGERKHIHFNEQVSQCIAVEVKGDDDDDDEADMGGYLPYDSDSDDSAIMMKRTKPKKRPILKKAKPHSANSESKTIAMLPSTKLKYREETSETPESAESTDSAMKHSTGVFRDSVISPSSSQETLRPSKKSGKLFIASDEDDDDDEDDEREQSLGRFSTAVYGEIGSGLRRSTSSGALTSDSLPGMRRTESGMFMPLEHLDSLPSSSSTSGDGMLGRIIDTKEATSTTHRPRQNPRSFSGGVR